jgi:hypothetical protein
VLPGLGPRPCEPPAPVRWGGGKRATGRSHMPGSITVAVRNSPCHARNDGNVTGWLRAPCAVVNCACRSTAKPGDLSRQRGVVNRPLLPRLGAVHCGPTGLMMLPGGTPASLRLWRNSAASASRSSPVGPRQRDAPPVRVPCGPRTHGALAAFRFLRLWATRSDLIGGSHACLRL